MRARYKLRPRSVLLLHGVGIAFVALLAVWLNWSASARRVGALSARIGELAASVEELRSAASVAASVVASSASSSPVPDSVASSPSRSRSLSRLLGSGTVRLASGRKLGYFDVRDAVGNVRRYYVDPSDPRAVRKTLHLIACDLRESESFLEDSDY